MERRVVVSCSLICVNLRNLRINGLVSSLPFQGARLYETSWPFDAVDRATRPIAPGTGWYGVASQIGSGERVSESQQLLCEANSTGASWLRFHWFPQSLEHPRGFIDQYAAPLGSYDPVIDARAVTATQHGSLGWQVGWTIRCELHH